MSIQKQNLDKIIIRGGKIIVPDKKIVDNPDIYIERGIIKEIKHQASNIRNVTIIQLNQNHYISPGFIDMHCHLREPGNIESETVETGTLSAITGGFTTICCMPNTQPSLDNPKIIKYIRKQAKIANNAEVLVIGCATKKRKGKEIADINKMVSNGIVAVSDDGSPISNSELMSEILQCCKKFNVPVINHCEVLSLSRDGVLNKGKTSEKLGLKGIPDIAESIMVLRDIMLAEQTKAHLHIAHVSTKKSVDLIRWAKKQGINITAETCPHYFTLTDKDCLGLNTNCKVSPPLRTKTDVEAVKEGLADGTIDAIATDHAPWHISKKNHMKPQDYTRLTQDQRKKSVKIREISWLKTSYNWKKAKSGMIGFETAFSLGYQELVLKKYLSLEKYIACLTTKPTQILNLKDDGKIAKNTPAAITIFDFSKDWTLSIENIISKSKNSPFIGRKLKGKIEKVIIKDKLFSKI